MSPSLCLYVCCKYRPLYQNQIFKIPITFYNARCRCSVLLWSHCNSHVLPVLWLTSRFRVMTKSQKPLHRAALYANAVADMLSSCVCPSLTSRCVSKRLNGSNWFLYKSFIPLCCKEIRVQNKDFPSATLSQIL